MNKILVYLRLFAEEHEMVVHFIAAARRVAIVAEGLAGGGGIEVGVVRSAGNDVRARVEQKRCVRHAVRRDVVLVVRSIPCVVLRAGAIARTGEKTECIYHHRTPDIVDRILIGNIPTSRACGFRASVEPIPDLVVVDSFREEDSSANARASVVLT